MRTSLGRKWEMVLTNLKKRLLQLEGNQLPSERNTVGEVLGGT